MQKTLFFVMLGIVMTVPFCVNAEIIISEVMYDPEGTDTDREWVEIYNSGAEPVDLSNWKLFEANTNHGMTSVQGGTQLPAGGYAVIVQKAESFLLDYSAYSGILLDSTFSLINTGEQLALKNGDSVEFSSTYDTSVGAAGDGKTLNYRDGRWFAAVATPGSVASSESNTRDDEGGQDGSISQNSSNDSPAKPKPTVSSVKINAPTVTVAGAHTLFGITGKGDERALSKCKYDWNFGDGDKQRDRELFRQYDFPGDYVIVLHVECGDKVFSSRQKIKVIAPDIRVRSLVEGVEISNNTPYELNLSAWHISVGTSFFTIPNDTFVLPHTKIVISNRIARLPQGFGTLLYPNGMPVDREAIAQEYVAPQTYVASAYTYRNYYPGETESSSTTLASVDSDFENLSAAVVETSVSEKSGWWWVVGLGAIIFFATGSFVVSSRIWKKKTKDSNSLTADDITIVE